MDNNVIIHSFADYFIILACKIYDSIICCKSLLSLCTMKSSQISKDLN